MDKLYILPLLGETMSYEEWLYVNECRQLRGIPMIDLQDLIEVTP